MEHHPSAGTSRKATHHWPWVSGLVAVVLAVALGVIIFLRHNGPFLFDEAWMGEILEHRAGWLDVPALALNFLGGGWFARILVPLGTILALVLVRKRWAALSYALSVILSILAVQLLKAVFDRPRPEEILVVSDIGSFPSGHVANAATLAVALALILGRTWVWYVGAIYTVAMALSRTYLGAHWLSDTIGGALLGAGIAIIVWAPLASRLNRERKPRPATDSVGRPLSS
ncbi:MAG TPA: phosphatase PAP2 family protein [Terrimesophilobacter sp.]|jgi:PAP2 superfamily.|uniref:phosphatase PAP2 family protein n=1 Tax=Terrimesophilobacter sp. TaxID=2906435 RepID=UPI002F954C2D